MSLFSAIRSRRMPIRAPEPSANTSRGEVDLSQTEAKPGYNSINVDLRDKGTEVFVKLPLPKFQAWAPGEHRILHRVIGFNFLVSNTQRIKFFGDKEVYLEDRKTSINVNFHGCVPDEFTEDSRVDCSGTIGVRVIIVPDSNLLLNFGEHGHSIDFHARANIEVNNVTCTNFVVDGLGRVVVDDCVIDSIDTRWELSIYNSFVSYVKHYSNRSSMVFTGLLKDCNIAQFNTEFNNYTFAGKVTIDFIATTNNSEFRGEDISSVISIGDIVFEHDKYSENEQAVHIHVSSHWFTMPNGLIEEDHSVRYCILVVSCGTESYISDHCGNLVNSNTLLEDPEKFRPFMLCNGSFYDDLYMVEDDEDPFFEVNSPLSKDERYEFTEVIMEHVRQNLVALVNMHSL